MPQTVHKVILHFVDCATITGGPVVNLLKLVYSIQRPFSIYSFLPAPTNASSLRRLPKCTFLFKLFKLLKLMFSHQKFILNLFNTILKSRMLVNCFSTKFIWLSLTYDNVSLINK